MSLIMFTKSLIYIPAFLLLTLSIYRRLGNTVEIEISTSTIENDRHTRKTSGLVLHKFDFMEKFEIEVPQECKETNFCESIPNYPEEIMKKLIKRLDGFVKFHNDTGVRSSTHSDSYLMNLCATKEETYIPKAVVNENGNWILVLNPSDNPVQIFSGSTCSGQNSDCKVDVTRFQPLYCGKCFQSHTEEKVFAINEDMNEVIIVPLILPSCCNCRAQRTKK